ncbi:tetratricopeptide repeat protein [Hyalangium gracile]|uniref:tetratricopeptide repeat protein n=1 Tax=Hyalangium gracile TaxID=394092 RepID=UPI001CCFF657|nr:tetratricopeptide repeat protein [Hyalangium gracile]
MGRFKLLLGTIALVGATLVPAHAEASIKVLGNGFGRICYEHAKAGQASDSGLEACDRALTEQRLTPSDRAATLVNRGILQMHARKHALALASYEEALKLNPDLAEAYVNKGVALVNLGRDAEAVEAIGKALELNTEWPEIAYYTRGIAHEMLGNVRSAYNDYRQAAALKPEWQEPQRQLQRFSVVPKGRG